jgi:hypothetical protein
MVLQTVAAKVLYRYLPVPVMKVLQLFLTTRSGFLKGIVSRDGVSIEAFGVLYSLDLNNSPRIGLTPGKSRIKNL